MEGRQLRGGGQAGAEQCVAAVKQEPHQDTSAIPHLFMEYARASDSLNTHIKQEVHGDDDVDMYAPHAQDKMELDESEEEECKIDIEHHLLWKWETVSDKELSTIATSQNVTEFAQDGGKDKKYDACVADFIVEASSSTHSHDQTKSQFELPTRSGSNQEPNMCLFKCARCEYGTKMITNMIAHRRVMHHHQADTIQDHVKVKHDQNTNVHKCTQCEFTTKTNKKCAQYDYAPKTPRKVDDHVKGQHDPNADMYKCAQCVFTTKWPRSLKGHVKVHHDPNAEVYKCLHCVYTTKSASNLRGHVKVKHDPNAVVYKCAQCDYVAKRPHHLSNHLKVMHDPNADLYKCARCQYTTKTKGNLLRHAKTKHRSNL